MALSDRLFFTTSLILSSLLILASASDYSYTFKAESYVSVPKPELGNSKSKDQGYSPKSSGDQQNYGSKPDTDEKSKPQNYNNDSKPQTDEENDHDFEPQLKEENGRDSTPEYKPQPNKENDHDYSKPQPEEKDDQNSRPEYKTQPSKEKGDDIKPDTYNKPQPEKRSYDAKPTDEEPQHGSKPEYNEPKSDEEKGKLLATCIEGLVFCRKGSNYIPVKGAVVRITCQVVGDDDECETFFSDVTDANGYFFKLLSSLKLTDGLKLKECRAFLEDSPMDDCKIPTDVNRGIRGALLNSYRILEHNNIKLFKVGPFFYTSESQYLDPNNGLTKLNLP